METKRLVARLFAGFVIGVAGLSSAHAAVLDQFQLDGSGQDFAVRSANGIEGQSFTAGMSGKLVGLEILLGEQGSGADLGVSIVDMSGGNIVSAPALGTVTLSETVLGPFPRALDLNSVTATLIDFSSFDIDVVAGDLLGFRLTTDRDLPDFFIVRLSLSDPYAAGAFYENDVPSTFKDAAFKVFIEPSGVPEPAPLALTCAALAGLWYAQRRGRVSATVIARCELPSLGDLYYPSICRRIN